MEKVIFSSFPFSQFQMSPNVRIRIQKKKKSTTKNTQFTRTLLLKNVHRFIFSRTGIIRFQIWFYLFYLLRAINYSFYHQQNLDFFLHTLFLSVG